MAVQRLILLSGAVGAGKTSIANALIERFEFKKIGSSDYLLSLISPEELKEGDERRRQLQELGDHLDQTTDYRWIVDPVATDAIAREPLVANWLVDAVRKKRQVEHFRELLGGNIRHIHLTAPEEILRARYTERGGSYDEVVAHPNEVNARSLITIADEVVHTTEASPHHIAEQIARFWGD